MEPNSADLQAAAYKAPSRPRLRPESVARLDAIRRAAGLAEFSETIDFLIARHGNEAAVSRASGMLILAKLEERTGQIVEQNKRALVLLKQLYDGSLQATNELNLRLAREIQALVEVKNQTQKTGGMR